MAGNKWQISDELWEKMAPLIPEHKTQHPLGTHRRRVDNRAAMNTIFCAQNRLSMECAECHRNMLIKLCSPPISGMAGRRSF